MLLRFRREEWWLHEEVSFKSLKLSDYVCSNCHYTHLVLYYILTEVTHADIMVPLSEFVVATILFIFFQPLWVH